MWMGVAIEFSKELKDWNEIKVRQLPQNSSDSSHGKFTFFYHANVSKTNHW